jgi:predicted Fe-S protein YdhL (DUF1289 family)
VRKGISESLADSPCTGRCANLGYPGQVRCVACGRTREQIERWDRLSEVERKLINIENWEKYMSRQKRDGLIKDKISIDNKLNGEN